MGRARREGLRPEIRRLRDGIERWRETRAKRSAMPEKLWEAATALARTHGVYRIAQDLHVNYQSLRTRVESGKGSSTKAGRRRRARRSTRTVSPTFVELGVAPAAVAAAVPEGGVVVEVQDPVGSKLTIRLGASSSVDVCTVLAAFRGEDRRGRR